MKVLTHEQANLIVDQSLGNLLPKATQLVWENFCSDCPRLRDKCFPCTTARTMIRTYLTNLVAEQARLN